MADWFWGETGYQKAQERVAEQKKEEKAQEQYYKERTWQQFGDDMTRMPIVGFSWGEAVSGRTKDPRHQTTTFLGMRMTGPGSWGDPRNFDRKILDTEAMLESDKALKENRKLADENKQALQDRFSSNDEVRNKASQQAQAYESQRDANYNKIRAGGKAGTYQLEAGIEGTTDFLNVVGLGSAAKGARATKLGVEALELAAKEAPGKVTSAGNALRAAQQSGNLTHIKEARRALTEAARAGDDAARALAKSKEAGPKGLQEVVAGADAYAKTTGPFSNALQVGDATVRAATGVHNIYSAASGFFGANAALDVVAPMIRSRLTTGGTPAAIMDMAGYGLKQGNATVRRVGMAMGFQATNRAFAKDTISNTEQIYDTAEESMDRQKERTETAKKRQAQLNTVGQAMGLPGLPVDLQERRLQSFRENRGNYKFQSDPKNWSPRIKEKFDKGEFTQEQGTAAFGSEMSRQIDQADRAKPPVRLNPDRRSTDASPFIEDANFPAGGDFSDPERPDLQDRGPKKPWENHTYGPRDPSKRQAWENEMRQRANDRGYKWNQEVPISDLDPKPSKTTGKPPAYTVDHDKTPDPPDPGAAGVPFAPYGGVSTGRQTAPPTPPKPSKPIPTRKKPTASAEPEPTEGEPTELAQGGGSEEGFEQPTLMGLASLSPDTEDPFTPKSTWNKGSGWHNDVWTQKPPSFVLTGSGAPASAGTALDAVWKKGSESDWTRSSREQAPYAPADNHFPSSQTELPGFDRYKPGRELSAGGFYDPEIEKQADAVRATPLPKPMETPSPEFGKAAGEAASNVWDAVKHVPIIGDAAKSYEKVFTQPTLFGAATTAIEEGSRNFVKGHPLFQVASTAEEIIKDPGKGYRETIGAPTFEEGLGNAASRIGKTNPITGSITNFAEGIMSASAAADAMNRGDTKAQAEHAESAKTSIGTAAAEYAGWSTGAAQLGNASLRGNPGYRSPSPTHHRVSSSGSQSPFAIDDLPLNKQPKTVAPANPKTVQGKFNPAMNEAWESPKTGKTLAPDRKLSGKVVEPNPFNERPTTNDKYNPQATPKPANKVPTKPQTFNDMFEVLPDEPPTAPKTGSGIFVPDDMLPDLSGPAPTLSKPSGGGGFGPKAPKVDYGPDPFPGSQTMLDVNAKRTQFYKDLTHDQADAAYSHLSKKYDRLTTEGAAPKLIELVGKEKELAFDRLRSFGAKTETPIAPKITEAPAPQSKLPTGWKLHLNATDPLMQESISSYLKQQGIKHKIGEGGGVAAGQPGKEMTVYVGAKDAAKKLAAQLEKDFPDLPARHPETLIDDMPFGTQKKIVGRFDANKGGLEGVDQGYGFRGIPSTPGGKSNVLWGGESPVQGVKDAHQILKNTYGEFYTGSQPKPQPKPTAPKITDLAKETEWKGDFQNLLDDTKQGKPVNPEGATMREKYEVNPNARTQYRLKPKDITGDAGDVGPGTRNQAYSVPETGFAQQYLNTWMEKNPGQPHTEGLKALNKALNEANKGRETSTFRGPERTKEQMQKPENWAGGNEPIPKLNKPIQLSGEDIPDNSFRSSGGKAPVGQAPSAAEIAEAQARLRGKPGLGPQGASNADLSNPGTTWNYPQDMLSKYSQGLSGSVESFHPSQKLVKGPAPKPANITSATPEQMKLIQEAYADVGQYFGNVTENIKSIEIKPLMGQQRGPNAGQPVRAKVGVKGSQEDIGKMVIDPEHIGYPAFLRKYIAHELRHMEQRLSLNQSPLEQGPGGIGSEGGQFGEVSARAYGEHTMTNWIHEQIDRFASDPVQKKVFTDMLEKQRQRAELQRLNESGTSGDGPKMQPKGFQAETTGQDKPGAAISERSSNSRPFRTTKTSTMTQNEPASNKTNKRYLQDMNNYEEAIRNGEAIMLGNGEIVWNQPSS